MKNISVYSLLNLLVSSSENYVLFDSDLVGKYNKISYQIPNKINNSDNSLMANWSRVVKLVGNNSRANLSLFTEGTVKVKVSEENKYNIPVGSEESIKLPRIYNIIHDGELNITKLAVKVDSSISEILKQQPNLIVEDLIFSNSYLLNLESLPIILEDELSDRLSIDKLAELEVKRLIYDIYLYYRKINIPKVKKTKTKEDYLRSLVTSPIVDKIDRKCYSIDELVTEILEISLSKLKLYNVIKYFNKNKTLDGIKSSYLSTASKKIINQLLNDYDSNEDYKTKYEDCIEKLRDSKLKYLIGDEKFNTIATSIVFNNQKFTVKWRMDSITIYI